MYEKAGTYPNAYTREYVSGLIENQSSEGLDTVSSASQSGDNFRKLAAAVMEQAIKGDEITAVVEYKCQDNGSLRL